MNPERLLEHYHRIADAEDAVPRLRRFVLDLAVRGKLVEQDPADEPAAELVKRIAVEKARLVRAGELKRQKSFPSVDVEPFSLPSDWHWVRLGELGITQTGSTPSKNRGDYYGSDVPFIRPGDLCPDKVDYSGDGLSRTGAEASGRLVPDGSILMVCIGTIGKCQIADRTVSFNQQINALTPYQGVVPRFVLLVVQSDFFQDLAWATSARTTIAILNKGNWERLPVPLPPPTEQHRIVAKVDELMALCDQLETARSEREATRDRLTTASLTRLTAPETEQEDFPAHTRFALDALPALTVRPSQIKTLRQTILNLAVRGKLVEQNPADEPATELLKQIAVERERAPKPVRRVKGKLVDPLLTELPFPLPESWSVAELSDLVRVVNGRAYKKSELLNEGTPVLRVGNLFTSSHWYYSSLKLEAEKYCEKGDLIYAWSASFGPFIWTGPRVIYHYHIWKLMLFSEADLDKQYLYLFLLHKTREIKNAGHGISMVHMTKGKMEILTVPLPPLAEQCRIVTKVDELMTLCDQLETTLTTADTTRQRLLDSLLHEALSSEEEREAAA